MAADPIEELPDEQSARLFGWSSVKRRMAQPDEKPGEPEAPRRPPGAEPPLRLRPSGQLSPIRRWGYGEDAGKDSAQGSPPAAPPINRAPPAERTDRIDRVERAEREQPPQRPAAPRTDEAVPGLPPVRKHYDAVAPGGAGRLTSSMRGNPQAEAAKIRLHEMLIDELEHGVLEGLAPEAQREAVSRAARELIAQENMALGGVSKDELALAVADEVLGLGPLEPLLRDPAISEVMVNDVDKIFYEQDGKIFRSAARFRDVPHMMRIIERIVAPLGRRIDESSPMVDARLMDGSRVNITIPPVSPKAPCITIRKFRADKMKMADLIAVGAMSEATAEFLAMCVRAKLNMIISGGTGTGKTTMLNALSAFIPNTERIVTIEDPAELKLQQEHVVTLEGRPPSIEGKNAVHQRDLVRNSLRMRPDRIIIGEVRGSECFDMLQAMNTGHDGSISTVHANNPRDGLARIENMVLMAGMDLPARAIREQIASAINIFVQVQRLQDGSRKLTHVTEVSGMEGDTITLQDIFLFKLDHIDEAGKVHGEMLPTGIRPAFAERFAMAGIELPAQLFNPNKEW